MPKDFSTPKTTTTKPDPFKKSDACWAMINRIAYVIRRWTSNPRDPNHLDWTEKAVWWCLLQHTDGAVFDATCRILETEINQKRLADELGLNYASGQVRDILKRLEKRSLIALVDGKRGKNQIIPTRWRSNLKAVFEEEARQQDAAAARKKAASRRVADHTAGVWSSTRQEGDRPHGSRVADHTAINDKDDNQKITPDKREVGVTCPDGRAAEANIQVPRQTSVEGPRNGTSRNGAPASHDDPEDAAIRAWVEATRPKGVTPADPSKGVDYYLNLGKGHDAPDSFACVDPDYENFLEAMMCGGFYVTVNTKNQRAVLIETFKSCRDAKFSVNDIMDVAEQFILANRVVMMKDEKPHPLPHREEFLKQLRLKRAQRRSHYNGG